MDLLSNIVAQIDTFIWGAPLLILLVGCHLYLTFRLKFIQRFVPLGIKLSFIKDSDQKGEIS